MSKHALSDCTFGGCALLLSLNLYQDGLLCIASITVNLLEAANILRIKIFWILLIFVLLLPGSPAILGDREEDADADDGASDFNYTSEEQNQKQKIAERMLSWPMAYGRGEDVGAPSYDKEVSHNNIPLLTNGTEVIHSDMPWSFPCLFFSLFYFSPFCGGGGGMAFEVELTCRPLQTSRFLENCLLPHLSIFLWLLLELVLGSVSILFLMHLMLINHVCSLSPYTGVYVLQSDVVLALMLILNVQLMLGLWIQWGNLVHQD